MKTCQIANCPNPATRKGLCSKHYMREYRKANPCKDNLETFINDLPSLLREVGAIGYTASYNHGTVTLKKLGSTLSTTWTTGA